MSMSQYIGSQGRVMSQTSQDARTDVTSGLLSTSGMIVHIHIQSRPPDEFVRAPTVDVITDHVNQSERPRQESPVSSSRVRRPADSDFSGPQRSHGRNSWEPEPGPSLAESIWEARVADVEWS